MVDLDRTERIYDELAHRAPRAPARSACCLRNVARCSTSGSTAATPRRSRSSAAPTAASPGTRARAAATSTRRDPGTAVDEIVRAATRRDRGGRRRRGGLRLLLARGRRLARRHRLLRGGARAPHPGRVARSSSTTRSAPSAAGPTTASAARSCAAPARRSARARADGRLWHVSWLAAPSFTIDLTRATLDAAVRSELGLMPPSALPARVAAAFGAADAAGAIERVTGRAPAPAARLARRPAARLRRRGRRARAASACAGSRARTPPTCAPAARACGLGEPTPITLAGGVMRHPSSLLVDALAEALPGASSCARAASPRTGRCWPRSRRAARRRSRSTTRRSPAISSPQPRWSSNRLSSLVASRPIRDT